MSNEEAIYTALNAIPKGFVVSYGGLAKMAGLTNGARQIGSALKKLPPDSTLPWHRVINSQRKISFDINSDQYKNQRIKLTDEGIIFINNKVSKSQFIDHR